MQNHYDRTVNTANYSLAIYRMVLICVEFSYPKIHPIQPIKPILPVISICIRHELILESMVIETILRFFIMVCEESRITSGRTIPHIPL